MNNTLIVLISVSTDHFLNGLIILENISKTTIYKNNFKVPEFIFEVARIYLNV